LIIKLGDLKGILVSQIIIIIYFFIFLFLGNYIEDKNDRYGRYVQVGEKVSLK